MAARCCFLTFMSLAAPAASAEAGSLRGAAVAAAAREAEPAQASVGSGAVVSTVGAESSWSGKGLCGVATNMLDFNDAGMTTFCNMDIDFWWNWAHVPRNIYSSQCAWRSFVPMIWGHSPQNSVIAKSGAKWLMGYNEPDLWAPPVVPGGDYLASGSFAPTFHCGSEELAQNWQSVVMAYKTTNPEGKVLSPSMADPSPGRTASTGSDSTFCNMSPQTPQQHMPFCAGWLKCFKESVMRKNCGGINCWDVIDVLQFHAYTYTAQDLIHKVQSWETLWAEDLKALNGRTKKTLWLTEFSRAGATDSSDPDGATRAFMQEAIDYLRLSPYVSGWSWFSQDATTFASFTINGVAPATPYWSSDLIDRNGQSTVIGNFYAELCKSKNLSEFVP